MTKQEKLCVFVTLEDDTGHLIDDELCRPILAQQGWALESWAWTITHPWQTADVIVLRSCYDYWSRPKEFTNFLTLLESLEVPVLNHPQLVRWNLSKRYLQQLEDLGVQTIDTAFIVPNGPPTKLHSFIEEHPEANEYVVKHVVGAGGFEMERLSQHALKAYNFNREMLVQPFLPQIEQGEWSAIFFADEPSHAVRKIAKAGEYRVQDSHGGTTYPVKWEDHPQLIEASRKVCLAIKSLGLPQSCYARYDFIEGSCKGELLLMEVEMIEPTLFLSHESNAAQRFSNTILRYACKQARQEIEFSS